MSVQGKSDLIEPEWENFFEEKVQRQDSLERVLGSVPMFSLLRAGELKKLANIVHVRRYSTGETVIRRGVKQSGFYLIRSGSVNIVRQGVDRESAVVGALKPPELIGEFALVDDSPRSTAIVAAEPSELIGFFRADLMDILVTNPSMGCAIVLRLGEQMGQTLSLDYARLRDLGYPFPERSEREEEIDLTTS